MKTIRQSLLMSLLCVVAGTAAGQCSDSSTTAVRILHVFRTGGNEVNSGAGTQVTGDYWYLWSEYVNWAEYQNPPGTTDWYTLNTGELYDPPYDQGLAYSEWTYAPSSQGPGTYYLDVYHQVDSVCYDSFNWSDSASLLVNKPSISGDAYVWWLGGSSDPSNGLTNTTALTYNSNCGPSDTCPFSATWSVTVNSSKVNLQCSVCATETVTSAIPSDTVNDMSITASMGGFSSDPFNITVFTPYRNAFAGATHEGVNLGTSVGWASTMWYWTFDQFDNYIYSVAFHEQLGTPASDRTDNATWPGGTAGSQPGFQYPSLAVWTDLLEVAGALTPAPSTPQDPLWTDKVDHIEQSWWMGSQTTGNGVEVETDRIQRYLDHGLHENIVSPL